MADSPSNYDLAVAAYRESCDRNNLTFRQPVEAFSKRIDNVIYMRTSSVGYVARYDIRRRQILV
ncbi:hypothetical protein IQ241_07845 [Romeria aff. gracilis LEGE 07310]|uniref:Uncharacterized protein n=1 Tax=Vasconcelosia minhoensis LEGE 07310 TaxID=915328 RepID=A0A8J7AMU2_9CYAN|nr:hypothetical protein [Romeria gracilis]MBE9077206.1 hypothetical protein [Romeria aff. gracilis LEGE 07310]